MNKIEKKPLSKLQTYDSLDKYFFNPDFHKFDNSNSDTHSADAPFNIKSEYTGSEFDKLKLLWKLVIIRALLDATSDSECIDADKRSSISWLTGNSRDFLDVCQMADIEPSIIKKITKTALNNPQEWHKQALKRYKTFSSKAKIL